jgi:hypothetical protein
VTGLNRNEVEEDLMDSVAKNGTKNCISYIFSTVLLLAVGAGSNAQAAVKWAGQYTSSEDSGGGKGSHLSIQEVSKDHFKISLKTLGSSAFSEDEGMDTGPSCSLDETFKLTHLNNGKSIFVFNSVTEFSHEKCKLVLEIKSPSELQIKDVYGSCRMDFCGVGAPLDGILLSRD